MQKYNSRNDVPEKYKWDLTDFFKSDSEFEKTLKNVSKDINKLKTYVGCTKDAGLLYDFLEFDSEIESILENLYVYAYLINDQELGNSKSMERKANVEKLLAIYSSLTAFFNPELLSLDSNEFKKLISNNILKEYKIMLERIYRVKEHVLSENEEIIVNELVSAMDHFDDMSSTMLNSEHDYGKVVIDGEETLITSTNLRKLLKNENQDIRREVYEKYRKVLNQYGVSSSQFLDSYVNKNVKVSKIRKYKSTFDAKLFNTNMSRKTYEALVSAVEENVDVLQDYMKLYKDTLKLKDLNFYDLSLDLASNDKKYTIEEAQVLVRNALKPLGEDYIKHFNKIIDNRYIDYCEYKGKCSGGYSFSTSTKDSRILLSFNDDLDSVSTIAHEAGHNVHHQYVKENNLIHYREVGSLVSEVASLTNECLLSSYLAEHGEKTEALQGIANILGVIDNNLFGAVREGKMEEDFYKHVENGNSITKDYMDELTLNSLKKYYGNTLKYDEYSNLSWIRRSHYYMNYYLYSYAICISVATYVASEILKGNKDMLDRYIKFLKTGGDKWPMEAFKVLGINLEEKNVYINAIKYFKDMLEKFKKLTKEV